VSAETAVAAGKTVSVETAPADQGQQSGQISFRLRIGVIGHVDVPDDAELRGAISQAVELAIEQVKEAAFGRKPGSKRRVIERIKDAVFRRKADTKRDATKFTLTVVSALAEGADRIVTDVVFQRPDSKLITVLPVYQEDKDVYLRDFKSDASRDTFQGWYDRAWRYISPSSGDIPRGAAGYTKEDRDQGSWWAATAVVRNCDVLIALWDREGEHGTAGTGDVIRWLRKRDRRISDAEPSTETGLSALGAAASLILPTMDEPLVLETAGPLRIIVPTKGQRQGPLLDDDPPFKAAADVARKRLGNDLNDLWRFNRNDPWWFHRKKFRDAKWRSVKEDTEKYLASPEHRGYPGLDGIFQQLSPPLIRADQAAIAANRLFLTLSALLYGCTAVATIIAALEAIVLPWMWWLTIVESVLLTASLVIVFLEKRWKTHERWTAYRFLAERLRSTCYLLAAGVRPETDLGTAENPGESGRHGWIRRAFAEVLAELNTREQRDTAERQKANGQEETAGQELAVPLDVINSLVRVYWVAGQIGYFKMKSARLMFQHQAVRALMSAVLFVTIAAGIVHSLRIWPLSSTPTQTLEMCAIGLPAIAGFLVNVRSLREFNRHATRYASMANVLNWYLDQSVQEPNAEHLRRLAVNIDRVLTAESRGWLGAVAEHGIEIHA
jgi:hypothetical protein